VIGAALMAGGLQVFGHRLHCVGVADLESSFLIEPIGQCGLRTFNL